MKLFISISLLCASLVAADFTIRNSTALTSQGAYHWSPSRPAIIPGDPLRVTVTTQEIEKCGSHGYRDLYTPETTDGAKTWSQPLRIETWERTAYNDGIERVFGDVCPQWRANTATLLTTGKCFGLLAQANRCSCPRPAWTSQVDSRPWMSAPAKLG